MTIYVQWAMMAVLFGVIGLAVFKTVRSGIELWSVVKRVHQEQMGKELSVVVEQLAEMQKAA